MEQIFDTIPMDAIVETGTFRGSSAEYFADRVGILRLHRGIAPYGTSPTPVFVSGATTMCTCTSETPRSSCDHSA